MITKMKSDGAVSTAGQSVKKGSKGKLELYVESTDDGDIFVQFRDYGNYGRERWSATFPCSGNDLNKMILSLQLLLSDDIETTKDWGVQPVAETGEETTDESNAAEITAALADATEEDEEEYVDHLEALAAADDFADLDRDDDLSV